MNRMMSWQRPFSLITFCCLALMRVGSDVVAGEPVRALPAPPAAILDLRANAAGDLYVRTATNVLWMDFQHPEEGWNPLALDGVVALTENVGHEVFALQDLKTRFAIHRLARATATRVTTTPNVPFELWYVDAVGRAWLQNKERLLVVGQDETLLERPMGQPGYGIRLRRPCEWKPGHVVLFFASEAVWATPEKVTAKAAPAFADDGTGNGPFLMGTDRLVSGGSNNKGAGSFLLDPREPGKAPERLSLGQGDWFAGVATAPDGRLLSRPHRGFVWYAADGRSEVKLKESGPILDGVALREPGKSRVVFAGTGVGFAALPGGMLVVFRPDEAVMLTPATGLPLPRVENLAVVGDDLIMAADGKIVVWRTTVPLPKPDAADLREWPLAGPCVRDINGTMWACLLDGKISHHDGVQWKDVPIELYKTPHEMTGDDKGMLQLADAVSPSGSALFRSGAVTNWPNEPFRAWVESMRQGATRFGDGSPFRWRHVPAGRAEWLWRYDGRSLWDDGREYDYYESPPYRYFWLGTNGTCYRGGSGQVWVFAKGRWTETETPPLSIGPDGVCAGTPAAGRLPVVYEGQLKLPLLDASGGGKTRLLSLNGNEAFIPAGDGGGWVGGYRIFRDACYQVAGRVYPGTNGHYLVEGNTLRFQPPQTLKLEGQVLEDGNDRRLACRITGVEPLYKPRLLVFLDGEFQEALASPDGFNLPPLRPGLHSIEVYAADGFGTVSSRPLKLAVDGGLEFPVTKLELDEAWALKPARLQRLPTKAGDRSILGRAMEIDADGTVWILVEGGVISLAPSERKAAFHQCPAQELLAARGRVWARAGRTGDNLRLVLLELRRDGVRRAVELYDDSSYGQQQIWADGAGGIWALSHHAAARWDGTEIKMWDRPLGYDAVLVPTQDGAVIHTRVSGYLVYRNGELSQPVPWPGDFKNQWQQADRVVYPLGRGFLVLPLQRLLLELDSGRPSDKKIPFGETYRQGADGSLYVWKGQEFYRISGDDLTVSSPEKANRPNMPPLWDPGGYEFLGATGGTVMYTVRDNELIARRPGETAVEYGWQHGVQPGRTLAIRAAPDGRLWIVRASQFLLYDPAQTADTVPLAWPGWRTLPIADRFATYAFGRVWYGNPDMKGFTSSDGTNEMTWAQRYPGTGAIIVSDVGTAAISAGTDTCLLTTNKPPERVQDLQSAILELVKRGAKSFEGDGALAVAADGRVYFRGKIWDGQAWHDAPDGRASLDPRGELFLLCTERSSLPVAYRMDGVRAVPLGQVEKCLIDVHGLRCYDAGLMEANPGCLPVWYASRENPQVSGGVDTARVGIDPHGSLQALPLGEGRFLLRVGAKLHVLDAKGLKRVPGSAVPCGDELDPGWGLRVWPLAEGRWALAVFSRIYISPPDFRFGSR